MATERARSRCRDQVAGLAGSDLDVDHLRREAIDLLQRAIGFDRWCTLLLDPDTLVAWQGIGHNDFWGELPRLNLSGAGLGDVNNHSVLARSRDHVGLLSAATGGDLARSERWREILSPYGVGDELTCVAVDELGPWGDFRLFRSSDDRPFEPEDARLMRELSALLARGLRRGAVSPSARLRPLPPRPESCCSTATCSRAARRTPHAPGSRRSTPPRRRFPMASRRSSGPSSAGCSRSSAARTGRSASARATATAAGRWSRPRASTDPNCVIVVSIRAAGVEDVLSLVSRALGLSARERELVALLLEGLDTRELAERLFISRHTVQDHLKSVFEGRSTALMA